MPIYEIEGTGFIPGVPGQFGNVRVKVEGETILEVVPLGQLFSDEKPAPPAATEVKKSEKKSK